jgi:hypothetical protein
VAANTTAWYFNKKNARAWSRSGPSWLAQCEIENKAGVCKKKVVSKNSFLLIYQLYSYTKSLLFMLIAQNAKAEN